MPGKRPDEKLNKELDKKSDYRKSVNRIIAGAAGIWFISLLVFLYYGSYSDLGDKSVRNEPHSDMGGFAAQQTLGKDISTAVQKNWETAIITAYGVWNLLIFGTAYFLISRRINRVLEDLNGCIQGLVDGEAIQHFSVREETLLGKFQVQILKLYEVLNSGKEREKQMREEMSEIVADLVHQVNTPLTNIQMYCGFLRDEMPEEEREQIFDVIDTQVEKLGWFAKGFAKTARLEEDIMQLKPEAQPVLDMVLAAIDEISLKAKQHGQDIALEGKQDIQAVFDRRWTEEALFNLLDNAVKYGEENCPITVEMTAFDLFVRITVKNWGTPIDQAEYNRLFARFYRGQNAALIQEGVGLGLFLARKIVSEQGGYVKAGKYGERGNQFSIYLPKGRGRDL